MDYENFDKIEDAVKYLHYITNNYYFFAGASD